MLIEEEEPKSGSEGGDFNPDALEAVFDEEIIIEEEEITFVDGEDEEADEIDIAFAANDEGYW